MRLTYYITAIVLWVLMIVGVHAAASSHYKGHEQLSFIFVVSGLIASAFGLLLAFCKSELAIGFGAFAIVHGLGLPFLEGPNIKFPVGLIMPAISIVAGVSAIIMSRKKS